MLGTLQMDGHGVEPEMLAGCLRQRSFRAVIAIANGPAYIVSARRLYQVKSASH